MKFIKENLSAIIFTIIVHIIVIGLFAINIDFDRDPKPVGKKVAVQAQIESGAALDAEIERQNKIEQDKLDQEIKRQKDLEDKALQAKQKREAEERRIAELDRIKKQKEAEAKKQAEIDKQKKIAADKKRKAEEEANKKKLAEQKKKAEAEKKRLAELEKKRAAEEENLEKLEAEKKRLEKEEADRKKKELEAKQKAEEEKKQKEAEEKARQAEIEAEEKRLAEEQERLNAEMAAEAEYEELVGSGAQDRYYQAIQQAIIRNWRPPSGVPDDMECTLDVSLIPGGEVTGFKFGQCEIDDAVKLSIEQAVFNASPFPEPEDERLFERREVLLFAPGKS